MYLVCEQLLAFFVVIFKLSLGLLVQINTSETTFIVSSLNSVLRPNFSGGLIFFLFYVILFFCVFSTFRSTLPRLRLDLLLDFIWKYLILYGFFVLTVVLFYLYMFNFMLTNFPKLNLNRLNLHIFLFKTFKIFNTCTLSRYLRTCVLLPSNRFSYYTLFISNFTM